MVRIILGSSLRAKPAPRPEGHMECLVVALLLLIWHLWFPQDLGWSRQARRLSSLGLRARHPEILQRLLRGVTIDGVHLAVDANGYFLIRRLAQRVIVTAK